MWRRPGNIFWAHVSGFLAKKDPASVSKIRRYVRILAPGSPTTFQGPHVIGVVVDTEIYVQHPNLA